MKMLIDHAQLTDLFIFLPAFFKQKTRNKALVWVEFKCKPSPPRAQNPLHEVVYIRLVLTHLLLNIVEARRHARQARLKISRAWTTFRNKAPKHHLPLAERSAVQIGCCSVRGGFSQLVWARLKPSRHSPRDRPAPRTPARAAASTRVSGTDTMWCC